MKSEIIRAEYITTKENGITALNNFFLNLYKGELLGVFTNNANEKKYLIDLICGNTSVEMGRFCFDNIPINSKKHDDTRKSKIALVDTKSKLIDDLSIANNIFVIRAKSRNYIISNDVINSQARILLKELEIDIDPECFVYTLTSFQKSVVEIGKAYGLGASVIILKDVSSYLSDLELEQLYEIIIKLKEVGISFIMIDSFVETLKKFSDRIIVMKNGKNIWTFSKEKLNEQVLKEIFYIQNQEIYEKRNKDKKTAITFSNISTDILENLSFTINSGDIFSIFDSDGKGIEEIVKILNGEIRNYKGDIFVGDKKLDTKNIWQTLKNRIAFIPENPAEKMIFKNKSVIDNLCYATSIKINGFWLKKKYKRSCIKEYEKYFSQGTLYKNVKDLSIYDIQKLVYLKWHIYNPKVVVCSKPFTSVDLELREITLEFINHLLKKGIAVIILTSNYSEVNIAGRKIEITTKEYPI